METNTKPDSKAALSPEPPTTAEEAADRPPFEPPRPRRPRPARKAILAFVVIMLTLYALLRIYLLVGNENLPVGNSTLPTKPAIAVLPFVVIRKPEQAWISLVTSMAMLTGRAGFIVPIKTDNMPNRSCNRLASSRVIQNKTT